MGDENDEDIAGDLQPLSREQEDEVLLTYLSVEIAAMGQTELFALRSFARSLDPGSNAEDRVIALIDGQLALREIRDAR